jgi:tetratricopeptide (TPR) repeat protein
MKVTTAAFGLGAVILAAPLAAQMPSRSGQEQQPQPQPSTADAAKEPQLRPSSGALKAIVDLQNAVTANDYANVPAKVAAARAVAKTKEDRYIIGQLHLKAALAAKDNAGMAAAIDAVASSGYIDAAKSAGLYQSLGANFYNAKQYDQAASALGKAIAANPNDPETLIMLGETRNAQGRKADAVGSFQRAIQVTAAAGQKPREELYKRAVGLAYDGQLPAATELARQWVAAYPGPDSWRNAVAIYRNTTKPDVEGTLDLLRLMQTTGALNNGADYSLFASAAAEQGNFVEAQSVLDAGIAAKIVDPARPDFRDIITGLKGKSKLTDADLAEAVKIAQTGPAMVRVGDRYFGLGQYPKAIELYRKAIAKGGTDANIANLHLGMALARSGDKAGAAAAFNAVSGPRAEIAKYWLLYLQTRG